MSHATALDMRKLIGNCYRLLTKLQPTEEVVSDLYRQLPPSILELSQDDSVDSKEVIAMTYLWVRKQETMK